MHCVPESSYRCCGLAERAARARTAPMSMKNFLRLPPFGSRESPAGRLGWTALGLAIVGLVAGVDYVTGYEFSLFVVYFLPILLATWGGGRAGGVAVALSAVAIWAIMFESQHAYSHPFYFFWEMLLQFSVYVIFVLILDRLKAALLHADERFATVLEGLDAAVYVVEPRGGQLLYLNEKCRQLFDADSLQPAQQIDMRFSAPVRGRPDGLPETPVEVQDRETRRWYLLAVQATRWVDGRRVELWVATDITTRKHAEELAREQHEKLETTSRLITAGEMATTLAHEMNQPLAAIANYVMGCVRRLQSGHWEVSELLEALEKCAAQAERASGVIQRLREFVARRQPQFVACDINDIVRGVSPAVEAEASQHSVRLSLELSSTIPYVQADPTLMEQVILNLARNAIEAMADVPARERELSIRSHAGADDTVEVEVADRGKGIDAEIESRLFSPFFSTKPHGMGLGLHISRSIVEAHGGHLWISRNGERGARFHFSLRSVFS